MVFNDDRGPFPQAFALEKCGILTDVPSRTNSFSVGFETLDRELFNPERCYENLGKCGVRYARCQSGWSRCERAPGVYDFTWLDRVVDRLLEQKIQPWLSLTFGNPLYSPDAKHPSAVGCPPVCYGEQAVTAWKNFITALVRRFSGRVCTFEIWNEPDNPQFWGPGKPCAPEYLELVRVTSEILRKECPGAKIAGGAMCSRRDFARECFQLGIGNYCDVFTMHHYGMYPEYGFADKVAFLRSLIREYAPGMELWNGEGGCPSESKDHYDEWLKIYRCDEEVQAKWLARMIATNFRHDVRFFSYYHASDLTEKPYVAGDGKSTKVGRCGLLTGETGNPKWAWRVMNRFCSIFDDSLKRRALPVWIGYDNVCDPVLECDRNRYLGILCDSYSRNGYPLFSYYYPGDFQRNETLFSALGNTFFAETEQKITHPVIADPLTGNVYRAGSFSLERGSLGLRSIPVTDYPLILTDEKALTLKKQEESCVKNDSL